MDIDFWDLLMERVRSGDMGEDEAYQRNNYYRFVERCPSIDYPIEYVLDMPLDALPPFPLEVYDPDAAADVWESCAQMVEDGQLTPYEGALEYYWAVKG